MRGQERLLANNFLNIPEGKIQLYRKVETLQRDYQDNGHLQGESANAEYQDEDVGDEGGEVGRLALHLVIFIDVMLMRL